MSHGIRRPKTVLELVRRPIRLITPWCEKIALLIAVTLAYFRLREEIGNWQALLAATGAPLAVLDGWSGRFVARRLRRRLLPAPVTVWIPAGHDVFISRRSGAAAVPAPRGPDRQSIISTPPIGRSQHCVLFAVDIVRFTDASRDDEVQLALREALYRLLIESFEGSGIPWRSCVHEDRGDGVVVVIPAHMPTITVVHPLVDQILVRLRRHNRLSSPVAQVRLRLAVHIGEVYRDAHGLAGKAVNHLFRMLDAPNLRQAVQSSELALIVSDYLYQNVIHGGPNGVDPGAYSEVTVTVKQFRARAWLLGIPA
jgi:hypothetical protein